MNSNCDFTGSDGKLSEALAISAACFSAMGLLCCVQMFFLIGITFNRRSGLYFWSLTGATVAQLAVCLSFLLQDWVLKGRRPGIPIAMSTLGYLFFAPCEYLVLYSRLHLLQTSKCALRFVLILAALEWSLAELPMAITGVLATVYPEATKMALANKICWEFEGAVYPTVDFVMCSLYFLQVKRMWGHSEDKMKWVLLQVVLMSTMMILIDISYLVLPNTMNIDWTNAFEVCHTMCVSLERSANYK
jgi:hypothetical protein